jgi:hypothetical protein
MRSRETGTSGGSPRSIDCHVGRRLWEARTAIGASAEAAAHKLQIPLEDYLEIEAGQRRAGAIILHAACACYGKRAGWFFEGLQLPDPQQRSRGSDYTQTLRLVVDRRFDV